MITITEVMVRFDEGNEKLLFFDAMSPLNKMFNASTAA